MEAIKIKNEIATPCYMACASSSYNSTCHQNHSRFSNNIRN